MFSFISLNCFISVSYSAPCIFTKYGQNKILLFYILLRISKYFKFIINL